MLFEGGRFALKIKGEDEILYFRARGRVFTPSQIDKIRKTVDRYPLETRTKISQRVCRSLRWKQPNGRLKDVACREVLRKLDQERVITLPKPKGRGAVWKKPPKLIEYNGDQSTLESLDFRKIEFKLANSKNELNLWDLLVKKYHYLDSSRIVGRQLKYLIFFDDRPIACLGWGDSSWNIRCREEWIGWTKKQLTKNRHLIINNVRFLILPWVQVPNLASYILSNCSHMARNDWEKKYGFQPVLLESYVDINKFRGICYKASNWVDIGRSSGYAKVGSFHHNSQTPKALFVFPLDRKFRKILLGKRK